MARSERFRSPAAAHGESHDPSWGPDLSLHADLKRALDILELLNRRWNNLAGFVKVVHAFIRRIDPSTEVNKSFPKSADIR